MAVIRDTRGGVFASDPSGAGDMEWATVAGMNSSHPMVGGPDVPGLHTFDVDRGRSLIVTQPGGGRGVTADAHGAQLFDDWRDMFDFRNSPAPYIAILLLAFLGFMQFRVMTRVGGKRGVSAQAALG